MRHFKYATLAASLCFGLGQGAHAQSLTEFDAQVRDTLLRNPQIILEVFELLESQEREAEAKQHIELISKNEKALFGDLSVDTPVLVEFLDYRCGYCRKNHPEILAFLEKNPNVVLIEKQFPILGEESVLLAKTALAIRIEYGEETYKSYTNAAMLNNLPAGEFVASFVQENGLDADLISNTSESDTVHNEIANVRGLARRMGVSGTPAFVTRNAIVPRFADANTLTNAVIGGQ